MNMKHFTVNRPATQPNHIVFSVALHRLPEIIREDPASCTAVLWNVAEILNKKYPNAAISLIGSINTDAHTIDPKGWVGDEALKVSGECRIILAREIDNIVATETWGETK